MIFELVYSSIDGKPFARTPEVFYGAEDKDTEPFELVGLLRDAFPNRRYDFCVCCFDGYENAVSL